MSKTDARVRYTLMVIEDCFLDLLGQKPLNKITVTELCQAAQINRATFYKHYLDIPDLMEKTEEKICAKLRSIYSDNSDISQLFINLFVCIKNELTRYAPLTSLNGDPNFFSRLFDRITEYSLPLTTVHIPPMAKNSEALIHACLSSAIGGIINHWIRTGMEQTPEQMSLLVVSLCSTIIDGINHTKIIL